MSDTPLLWLRSHHSIDTYHIISFWSSKELPLLMRRYLPTSDIKYIIDQDGHQFLITLTMNNIHAPRMSNISSITILYWFPLLRYQFIKYVFIYTTAKKEFMMNVYVRYSMDSNVAIAAAIATEMPIVAAVVVASRRKAFF